MPYVSPYRLQTPAGLRPDNGSLPVWRYLGLAALVSILSNRQLPLVRMDLFDDPFEGSVPPSLPASVKTSLGERVSAEQLAAGNRIARKRFFVSCWTGSDHESEAMWRLYCGLQEGVALRTTYEKLDASLPNGVSLGMVRYVDYASWDLKYPIDLEAPAMHKRLAFAHEHEVRVVFLSTDQFTITGQWRHTKH